MKSRIFDENLTVSCLSHKMLNFNKFTVKMCNERFVQMKTIPIKFTSMLWKKFTSIPTSLKFFCKFPSKNFDSGGDVDRKGPGLEPR